MKPENVPPMSCCLSKIYVSKYLEQTRILQVLNSSSTVKGVFTAKIQAQHIVSLWRVLRQCTILGNTAPLMQWPGKLPVSVGLAARKTLQAPSSPMQVVLIGRPKDTLSTCSRGVWGWFWYLMWVFDKFQKDNYDPDNFPYLKSGSWFIVNPELKNNTLTIGTRDFASEAACCELNTIAVIHFGEWGGSHYTGPEWGRKSHEHVTRTPVLLQSCNPDTTSAQVLQCICFMLWELFGFHSLGHFGSHLPLTRAVWE